VNKKDITYYYLLKTLSCFKP